MKEIQKKQYKTGDGSPTLYMKQFDEYYHSKHGALQEALHVYLDKGFQYWQNLHPKAKRCRIFEMGFGTGLNAFLTAEAANQRNSKVFFDSIEAYPLEVDEQEEVGYNIFFRAERKTLFEKIVKSPWEKEVEITPCFYLNKMNVRLEEHEFMHNYDLIFYDAFGARTQPELWEDTSFSFMTDHLNPGGVFVTYSAKGSVRRALEDIGLEVSLELGPPGKREMIRAIRPYL